MNDKPRICFVGLKCYDLLTGADTPRYIGGIESQLVLLGRGLAERGYSISFVTFDHGQPDGEECDGIRIYKAFASDAGLRGLRFLYPRWTGLCTALRRADADIYYQMGAGCETGQVAMWCCRHARRFVFATASDADCVPDLPLLQSRREKCLFHYGLKRADLIISQTQRQCDLLSTHYDISSEQLGITTCDPERGGPLHAHKRRVLWVGRISPEKRPHLLLEIAHLTPEFQIDVIGDANANSEYAQAFRRDAEKMASIVLHGRVASDVLDRLYSETVLLINTSQTEGFPVTFIEAWSRGIPVVSTFDPDGVIVENNLGRVSTDINGLIQSLRGLMSSQGEYQLASDSARSYYVDRHSVKVCTERFVELLDGVNRSQPACHGSAV